MFNFNCFASISFIFCDRMDHLSKKDPNFIILEVNFFILFSKKYFYKFKMSYIFGFILI